MCYIYFWENSTQINNCLFFLYFLFEGRNLFKIALGKFSSLLYSVPTEKKLKSGKTCCDVFLFEISCHTEPAHIQCDQAEKFSTKANDSRPPPLANQTKLSIMFFLSRCNSKVVFFSQKFDAFYDCRRYLRMKR